MAKEVRCDARVADGAIRGGLVGALWVGFFGPSELQGLHQLSRLHVAASAARYSSICILSFGGFFGAYNGIQCATERVFGSDSLACPTLAGGTIGAAIGAFGMPPPHMLNAGLFAAAMAAVSGTSAWLFSGKQSNRARGDSDHP